MSSSTPIDAPPAHAGPARLGFSTETLRSRDAVACGPDHGGETPLDSGVQVRLLVVGADAGFRHELRERLAPPRWSIREARSGAEAYEKLLEERSEIMLLSSQLCDLDVVEFQQIVRSQFPEVQVVELNPPLQGAAAHAAPASGAAYEVVELLQPGRPGPEQQPPPAAVSFPRLNTAHSQQGWQGMIGTAPAMQRVYHAARLVARRDTTVLIQGESGTGKDLVARAIHASSARDKQPFVVINCAAIPEPLLEAELFGYTKGAFTGATQSRIGRIHAAHGGTLFLDEIGDMPYPLQSKILRFLEQGEVQRIGGTDTLKVDCRVVAATNADLKKLASSHHFREDLYYSLAVFPI